MYCLRMAGAGVNSYLPAGPVGPVARVHTCGPGKTFYGSRSLLPSRAPAIRLTALVLCQMPVEKFFSTNTASERMLTSLAASLHRATTEKLGQYANVRRYERSKAPLIALTRLPRICESFASATHV